METVNAHTTPASPALKILRTLDKDDSEKKKLLILLIAMSRAASAIMGKYPLDWKDYFIGKSHLHDILKSKELVYIQADPQFAAKSMGGYSHNVSLRIPQNKKRELEDLLKGLEKDGFIYVTDFGHSNRSFMRITQKGIEHLETNGLIAHIAGLDFFKEWFDEDKMPNDQRHAKITRLKAALIADAPEPAKMDEKSLPKLAFSFSEIQVALAAAGIKIPEKKMAGFTGSLLEQKGGMSGKNTR